MGTFLWFVYTAVAGFAVLAQPVVTQETNPFTYCGQILQADGSQICHSGGQRERVRNEVDGVVLSLLRETVVPLLQNFSCGGSTGWRHVAYLDTADTFQQCPSVWRKITTPHRVCGRRSTTVKDSLTPLVVSSMIRCVGGSLATSLEIQTLSLVLVSQLTLGYYVDEVSVTRGSPRQHI